MLKTRGCINEAKYKQIVSFLEQKVDLKETIDTTVENITHEDKLAVLELIRKMKKSSVTKRLIGLVKSYYAEEAQLDEGLLL